MSWDAGFMLNLFLSSFSYWWVIIPALLIGTVVGAVPGFNAANTIIILLPMTLVMPVDAALVFMMSLYAASQLGNAIPAILVNIPGTAGAAATTLDGYPMAKKGKAQEALVVCFVASVFGGLVGTAAIIAFLPYLARVGYYLHSVEMVVVMIFGLTLIAAITAEDMLKGLIAGFLGLLIGAIGTDVIYSTPRGTFGLIELYDGVPLVPALIGFFAVTEALVMIERRLIISDAENVEVEKTSWWDTIRMCWDAMRHWWLMTWTSMIGVIVGIVPGAGAGIAAFLAYQQAKLWSNRPELFGTGIPEGVIAPESSSNSVTSGALVPLLAIGVPGGITTAVMMIVLQYQGIVLGPRLFIDSPELTYGVFTAMMVAYIFMIPLMLPLARYLSRVTLVPTHYLAPLIIGLTAVGSFAPRALMFDMLIALLFGIIGYIARKSGFQVAAILIGIILGPLFEQYLMRALRISQGDPSVLFSSTLGNILWGLLVLSLFIPYLRGRRQKKRLAAGIE